MPLTIAARDDEVDNAKDNLAKPDIEEETCDGEANTADRGSSLQSDKGCNKDEDDGCRGGWLAVAAVGSRLVLTGPPTRGALSEKNSGKSAETARESKARRVENLSLWAHPQRGQSDRSSGSAFSSFFPSVVVAMSVVACVANAR